MTIRPLLVLEPGKIIVGLRNALSLWKGVVIEAFVKRGLLPRGRSCA